MRPPRGGAAARRHRRAVLAHRSATASGDAWRSRLRHRAPRRRVAGGARHGAGGERGRRLDHVVVTTARADESRRVYEDVLGLRLALDRTFEERGLRLLFFRVGGVTVEVAGSLAGGDADSGVDDLWGLAYKVADVDAARRRLAAGGFDVTEARRGHKQGTRVFTVRSGTNGVATLVIGPEREDG
jgi:catechol 2,3-dioxygenase-like lactoylglutathione lyase family enzyme